MFHPSEFFCLLTPPQCGCALVISVSSDLPRELWPPYDKKLDGPGHVMERQLRHICSITGVATTPPQAEAKVGGIKEVTCVGCLASNLELMCAVPGHPG